MKCDDCLYTDIVDWEQDGETLKGTPIYWCERYKLLCSDVTDCKYKVESGIRNDKTTDNQQS